MPVIDFGSILIWVLGAAGLITLTQINNLISLLSNVIDFLRSFRDRRRIAFSIITVSRDIWTWSEDDFKLLVEDRTPPGIYGEPFKPGDCREAFTIIEFTIKNNYPSSVTVGRIMLDNWMFADHYTHSMYDWYGFRNYAAFDLISREQISLEPYRVIPSGGSYSIRLEIHEYVAAPNYYRDRNKVSLPRSYPIIFHSDVGVFRHKIKLPRPNRTNTNPYYIPHIWSDLKEQPRYATSGAPRPAGLPRPYASRSRLVWRQFQQWRFYLTYRIKALLVERRREPPLDDQPSSGQSDNEAP
jgi:hypothetical protein